LHPWKLVAGAGLAVVARRQALLQPSEEHLIFLSLAREVLQLFRDDLHLLHNLYFDFFARHRRWL
jgi:hypothetical protein